MFTKTHVKGGAIVLVLLLALAFFDAYNGSLASQTNTGTITGAVFVSDAGSSGTTAKIVVSDLSASVYNDVRVSYSVGNTGSADVTEPFTITVEVNGRVVESHTVDDVKGGDARQQSVRLSKLQFDCGANTLTVSTSTGATASISVDAGNTGCSSTAAGKKAAPLAQAVATPEPYPTPADCSKGEKGLVGYGDTKKFIAAGNKVYEILAERVNHQGAKLKVNGEAVELKRVNTVPGQYSFGTVVLADGTELVGYGALTRANFLQTWGQMFGAYKEYYDLSFCLAKTEKYSDDGKSVTDTLGEGKSKTYPIGGKKFTVAADFVGSTNVVFSVNGEFTYFKERQPDGIYSHRGLMVGEGYGATIVGLPTGGQTGGDFMIRVDKIETDNVAGGERKVWFTLFATTPISPIGNAGRTGGHEIVEEDAMIQQQAPVASGEAAEASGAGKGTAAPISSEGAQAGTGGSGSGTSTSSGTQAIQQCGSSTSVDLAVTASSRLEGGMVKTDVTVSGGTGTCYLSFVIGYILNGQFIDKGRVSVAGTSGAFKHEFASSMLHGGTNTFRVVADYDYEVNDLYRNNNEISIPIEGSGAVPVDLGVTSLSYTPIRPVARSEYVNEEVSFLVGVKDFGGGAPPYKFGFTCDGGSLNWVDAVAGSAVQRFPCKWSRTGSYTVKASTMAAGDTTSANDMLATTIYVVNPDENAAIAAGDYFVVGKSLLQYLGASAVTESNPTARFNVLRPDGTIEIIKISAGSVGGTIKIGVASYAFTSATEPIAADYSIYVDLNGDGNIRVIQPQQPPQLPTGTVDVTISPGFNIIGINTIEGFVSSDCEASQIGNYVMPYFPKAGTYGEFGFSAGPDKWEMGGPSNNFVKLKTSELAKASEPEALSATRAVWLLNNKGQACTVKSTLSTEPSLKTALSNGLSMVSVLKSWEGRKLGDLLSNSMVGECKLISASFYTGAWRPNCCDANYVFQAGDVGKGFFLAVENCNLG